MHSVRLSRTARMKGRERVPKLWGANLMHRELSSKPAIPCASMPINIVRIILSSPFTNTRAAQSFQPEVGRSRPQVPLLVVHPLMTPTWNKWRTLHEDQIGAFNAALPILCILQNQNKIFPLWFDTITTVCTQFIPSSSNTRLCVAQRTITKQLQKKSVSSHAEKHKS